MYYILRKIQKLVEKYFCKLKTVEWKDEIFCEEIVKFYEI